MAQATTFKPADQYIKQDLHDETIPAPTNHATVARRLPRFRFRGLGFIKKSSEDNRGSAETNNSAQISATATTPEQENVEKDQEAQNTDHPPTDPEALKTSESLNEAAVEKKPGFLKRFRTMLTPKSSRHDKTNVEEAHSQPNVTVTDQTGASSATDVANAESASTLTTTDHNSTRPQTAAGTENDVASGTDKVPDKSLQADDKHEQETAPQKTSGSRSQSPAGKPQSRSQSPASKPQSRPLSPETKLKPRSQSPVAEDENKETSEESDAAGAHSETVKEPETEAKTHNTRTKGLTSRKSSAKGPRKDEAKSPTPETEDGGHAGIPAPAVEDTPSGLHDAEKLHSPQLMSPAPTNDEHTDSSKDDELPEPPKPDFLETAMATAASFKTKGVVKEPESDAEATETEPKEPIAAAQ